MALAIGLLITFYFKNQKTENIENAFKVIAAQVLEEKNSSLTKENIERVNVVLELKNYIYSLNVFFGKRGVFLFQHLRSNYLECIFNILCFLIFKVKSY